MNSRLSPGQRDYVRSVEAEIEAVGDQDCFDLLVVSIREFLTFGIFHDVYGIEELATRVGSSSRSAPTAFDQVASDSSLTMEERSFAALASAIGHRRAGSITASDASLNMLDGLEVAWADFDAFILHLRAVNLIGADQVGLSEGIRLSRRAIRLLPASPGVMHCLANLLLEYGIWEDSATPKRDEVWREALELVNSAIELSDWPKYHFTKGRILTRVSVTQADISEALGELRLAANLEAKTAFDSNERRITYTLERSLAEIRLVISNGESTIAQRMDDTRTELRLESEALASHLGERILVESRAAQNQSIMVIGFVTVALAMLPLASSLFGFVKSSGLPLVLAGIAMFAAILWGAVALATWSLNRGLRRSIDAVRQLAVSPSAPRGFQ